eukprot:1160125-Pelagomonas_calceolata.AAC.6
MPHRHQKQGKPRGSDLPEAGINESAGGWATAQVALQTTAEQESSAALHSWSNLQAQDDQTSARCWGWRKVLLPRKCASPSRGAHQGVPAQPPPGACYAAPGAFYASPGAPSSPRAEASAPPPKCGFRLQAFPSLVSKNLLDDGRPHGDVLQVRSSVHSSLCLDDTRLAFLTRCACTVDCIALMDRSQASELQDTHLGLMGSHAPDCSCYRAEIG